MASASLANATLGGIETALPSGQDDRPGPRPGARPSDQARDQAGGPAAVQPGDRNRRRTAPLYSLRGGIPALASTWPGIGPISPPAVPAFGCFHASSPGLRSSLWEVDSWGEPRIGSCLIQHGEQLLGRLPCRLRFRFIPPLPRLVCASWRGRAVPIGPAVSRSRRRMAVADIYDGARAPTRPGPAPPECRSRATGCSASTPRGPMVS
jgi:hypothetical protein